MNKLFVFSLSLFATSAAVYLYSPVLISNADDTANVSTSVDVGTVASISLDTNNLVFNMAPTETGAFDSNSVTATIDTNSTGGYELYFSSEDENTNMTHSNPNVSSVIASDFSGTVTSSTMAANKWGYSLDNTNFSKIPTASSQAKIKDINHLPSAAEGATSVYIGTKVSSSLVAGSYSKSVKFSVVAHETPQSIQSFNCSSLASVHDGMTLIDTRDGNTYTVKRLKDGNCWMTDNLRISNKTLTPDDSDVSSNFTLPASSTTGFISQNTSNVYVDDIYSGHYTFYAATAGTGGTNIGSGDAPSSICPKGWRLPTSSEFQTLTYSHYSTPALMMDEPGFTLDGDVFNNKLTAQGSIGRYWSSTLYNTDYAYYMSVSSGGVSPGSAYVKYDGYSVRCVAR